MVKAISGSLRLLDRVKGRGKVWQLLRSMAKPQPFDLLTVIVEFDDFFDDEVHVTLSVYPSGYGQTNKVP